MIRNGDELLQQRRQRDRVWTHRIRVFRLPDGARLENTQAYSGALPQWIDIHLLEVAVRLGVATVAARETKSASDRPPVPGRMQGTDESLRIDEGLLPIGAQAPQIDRHQAGVQIGENSGGGGQRQQTDVVRDQPQPMATC